MNVSKPLSGALGGLPSVIVTFSWYPHNYGKCHRISYIKLSDKMRYANSVDPNMTAPEGAVISGSTLFATPLSLPRSNCIIAKLRPKKNGISLRF